MANLQRRRLLTMGLATGAFAMLPMNKALAAAWAQEHTQVLNHVELALIEMSDAATAVATDLSYGLDLLDDTYNRIMRLPAEIMDKLGATRIMQTIGKFTQMYSKIQNLYGSIAGMKDKVQSRMQAFAASGLDWQSYAQRESAMAQVIRDRHDFMNEGEREALRQVEENYKDIEEFQNENKGVFGTMSSFQLLNSQMSKMLTITNSAYGLQAQTQYIERATEQDRFERSERIKRDSEEFYNDNNKALKGAAKTMQDWRP